MSYQNPNPNPNYHYQTSSPYDPYPPQQPGPGPGQYIQPGLPNTYYDSGQQGILSLFSFKVDGLMLIKLIRIILKAHYNLRCQDNAIATVRLMWELDHFLKYHVVMNKHILPSLRQRQI